MAPAWRAQPISQVLLVLGEQTRAQGHQARWVARAETCRTAWAAGPEAGAGSGSRGNPACQVRRSGSGNLWSGKQALGDGCWRRPGRFEQWLTQGDSDLPSSVGDWKWAARKRFQ